MPWTIARSTPIFGIWMIPMAWPSGGATGGTVVVGVSSRRDLALACASSLANSAFRRLCSRAS